MGSGESVRWQSGLHNKFSTKYRQSLAGIFFCAVVFNATLCNGNAILTAL